MASIESVKLEGVEQDMYFYPLENLDDYGIEVSKLPVSVRIVLESLIRKVGEGEIDAGEMSKLSSWGKHGAGSQEEVPFYVSRVVMHDLGLGNLVDLASLRDVAYKKGIEPSNINPVIPVNVIIDHSVQVDNFGTPEAFALNQKLEYQRNRERYEFIKWFSKSFKNVNVLPPSVGIIHQINLEYLSDLATVRHSNGKNMVFPDTVLGMDSHTPMINGMGVLGWGVGGIEATAALLGEPIGLKLPEVIGIKVKGNLPPGIVATDIVLRVTEILRKRNMVGKFVEFFGPSLDQLSVFDRATISNMCPEYGATVALFPVDKRTVDFLKVTGRKEEVVKRVERYYRAQKMFSPSISGEIYSDVVELDLSEIEPSLAGPNLPNRRIPVSGLMESFSSSVSGPSTMNGRIPSALESNQLVHQDPVKDGDVVIAAITSCTNTSNPRAMIGAGLLAKKAVERGLEVKSYVKTSLSPGSRVVEKYLHMSGLQEYLDRLGFNITGFGCMTCVGRSGPLKDEIEQAVNEKNYNVVAVTSSNRNFESRINKLVKSNYIASPQLVVAMALSGTVLRDLSKEAIGTDHEGSEVFLEDIWPSDEEVQEIMSRYVTELDFGDVYSALGKYSGLWDELGAQKDPLFKWDSSSTYIKPSPFLEGKEQSSDQVISIDGARILMVLGDNVSTDHISPEGSIPVDSEAGKYLLESGASEKSFDSYGARRGNPDVKVRGAFTNNRLRNLLVDREGGYTRHFPDKEEMTIFRASTMYRDEGVPLVVFAGDHYGMGSSRDWAAKGTYMLGISAVIARSFERIHRENLVCMGILPLQFPEGRGYDDLNIDFSKGVSITTNKALSPGSSATMKYSTKDNEENEIELEIRMETGKEVEYYLSGGIMPYVLKRQIEH